MNGFISFEGIDGSGKTTQIKLLSKYLEEIKVEHLIVREPGGVDISEKIRKILLDKNNEISKNTETLLFLAARSQLVKEIIKPSLNKKKIVLCDRYIDSTVAYQGYGHNLNLNLVNKMNSFAVNKLFPDLTFLFDLKPDTAYKRISKNSLDRMELKGVSFLKKVREGYLSIANLNSARYRIIPVDGLDIITIHNKVTKIVNFYLKRGK